MLVVHCSLWAPACSGMAAGADVPRLFSTLVLVCSIRVYCCREYSSGLHDLGNGVNQLTVVHRLDHGGDLDQFLLSKGHGTKVPFFVEDVRLEVVL